MTMAQFYGKCGDLIETVQGHEGESPRRKHHVTFHYTRGWARYNGESWLYHISPV